MEEFDSKAMICTVVISPDTKNVFWIQIPPKDPSTSYRRVMQMATQYSRNQSMKTSAYNCRNQSMKMIIHDSSNLCMETGTHDSRDLPTKTRAPRKGPGTGTKIPGCWTLLFAKGIHSRKGGSMRTTNQRSPLDHKGATTPQEHKGWCSIIRLHFGRNNQCAF